MLQETRYTFTSSKEIKGQGGKGEGGERKGIKEKTDSTRGACLIFSSV